LLIKARIHADGHFYGGHSGESLGDMRARWGDHAEIRCHVVHVHAVPSQQFPQVATGRSQQAYRGGKCWVKHPWSQCPPNGWEDRGTPRCDTSQPCAHWKSRCRAWSSRASRAGCEDSYRLEHGKPPMKLGNLIYVAAIITGSAVFVSQVCAEILREWEFVTICEQAFRRVLPRESLMFARQGDRLSTGLRVRQ